MMGAGYRNQPETKATTPKIVEWIAWAIIFLGPIDLLSMW